MRVPSRGILPVTAAFLLLAAACGGSANEPAIVPRDDGAASGEQSAAGLRHVVTLDPASPVSGTNVTLQSVLINTTSAPIDVTGRICGLDYEGTLTLTHPPEVMKCAGVSGTAPLAPGDSLVVHDIMRVTSAPGSYTLKVRHAISPEHWRSVSVVVRAP